MNNEFPGYTRNELMDLMNEYNNYIMQANDDNDYQDGWRPVSLYEFEQNEYQDILEERDNAMKTYEVSFTLEVEADNEGDAVGIAWDDMIELHRNRTLEPDVKELDR